MMSMMKILLLNVLVCGVVYGDNHETNLPATCHKPPDTTDCGSLEERWFYHSNLRACSKYTYRGCGKSPNNFATKEDCEKLCLPPFEEQKKMGQKTTDVLIQDNAGEEKEQKSDKTLNEDSHIVAPEENHNKKVTETKPNKAPELENNKDDIEELVKEQEQIRKRFNMADNEDFLTLEKYLQDENTETADVISVTEDRQPKNGEISGHLYKKDSPLDNDSKEKNQQGSEESSTVPSMDANDNKEKNQQGSEESSTVLSMDAKLIKEEQINHRGSAQKENKKNGDDEVKHQQSHEGSKNDEDFEELVEEQEQIRRRFNMADNDDFLTLEKYLQEENTETADIIPVTEERQQKNGEILGHLYEQSSVEEDIVNNKQDKEVRDDRAAVSQNVNEASDKVNSKESNSEGDDKTETDDAFEDKIKEESKLMERYTMADANDMLALQEVVQSPNMEMLEEVSSNQDENGIERKDENSELNKEPVNNFEINTEQIITPQEEGETDEMEEAFAKASERREHFNMADDTDYLALEDLMANPEVQEMEIMDESYDVPNGDEIRIAHMELGRNPSTQDHAYNKDSQIEEQGPNSAKEGYGEHLDHTGIEDQNQKEDSEDATIQFEQKLENQFNMASRDDILSLEQMIQTPNVDMAEIVEEKTDEKQPGDIKGVLSLAASFMGENGSDETKQFKEINEEIGQLPNVAREPIAKVNIEIQKDFQDRNDDTFTDFRHPADKLNEQEFRNSDLLQNGHPMNFPEMRHNDKMMLISLLHLDGLKVNRLPGTTTPVLKPFEIKGDMMNTSPKEDFIDILKMNGVRKCCLLPRDPGPCKHDKMLQWHFDAMIGTCLPFFYGGCKGNRNRFDTIGECLRKCGSRNVMMEHSLPEPIPEPPTSKSAFMGLKSMISNLVPGKILSLQEKMSPNQQKFIHKFIKSALKHVAEIKPIKISPFLPNVFTDKRNDKLRKDSKPLKSIMFKWPILRMVFDKRNNRGLPFPGRPEPREGFPSMRIPVEKFMRPGPRDFRRMSRERDENPFNEFRKRGRDNEDNHFRKQSKHFSPNFKKSYKMLSHHEDNRHQISSDPKNKVNLIQVFVNKPNTESNSNPSHHHTMIKKHFSPEPQIKAPLPPAPPVNINTPPQSFPSQPLAFPQPQPMSRVIPPQNHPHTRHLPPLQRHVIPPHSHNDMHINTHHHHQMHHSHPPHFNAQTHFHVHQPHAPMMPYPPPPFFEHPRPWWMRFDRPYYEPPFAGPTRRNHPFIVPSTGYPQKEFEDTENGRHHPEKEDVVVVTIPPGKSDDEPHYACLLPVSTGSCKAFLEKYYFNTATGECEMFIYGGCGGNANNFGSKEECQATCTSTSPVPKLAEVTTRPDDTIIITSPVYAPNSETEKNVKDKEQLEKDKEIPVDGRKTQETVKSESKISENESDSVKVEPVSLFKSSNTEYIIVIAVMCFVGLAVIILVALAVANLSRRSNVSKKERVLEAVLSSHLEGRSIGSITPRSHYYGHPPSETGPPPISDVPKIHKESYDEQL